MTTNLEKILLLFELRDCLQLLDREDIKFIINNTYSVKKTFKCTYFYCSDNITIQHIFTSCVRWFKNGYMHKDNNKPAITFFGPRKEWYENGLLMKIESQ